MGYLTVTEFADRIGVSANTIRGWDRDNKLKPHHVTEGGKRLYSEEQVMDYTCGSTVLDSWGMVNGVPFIDLPKNDMKTVIDKYEADFAEISRNYQGMLGLMKSIYNMKKEN